VPAATAQWRSGSPFDSSEPVSSMEVLSRTRFGGRDGFGVAVLEGFVFGVEVGVLGVVDAVGVVVGVVSAAGCWSLPQATTSSPIAATQAVPVRRACFHPRVAMSPTFS
jgi:hypothetical protein